LDCKIFFICYIITSKGHIMNKQQVEDLLQQYFAGILVHQRVFGELLNALSQTGVEKEFFRTLQKYLGILSQMGINATRLKGFEHIGSGIYSMRFIFSSSNIRILYAFRGDEEPILLFAFYERAGKSCTDYSAPIKAACDRLTEMKGMN